MQLLVSGGRLVTGTPPAAIDRADIAIVGSRIAAIGPRDRLEAELGSPDAVLDATDRYVIPGLVNAHTHLFQAGMRGLGAGLALDEWHARVMQPAYAATSAEDAYWFTLVGCIENLRAGVTTVVNVQAYPHDEIAVDLTARAIGEAGIRGALTRSFYGRGVDERLRSAPRDVRAEVEAVFKRHHGSHGGRLRVLVGPPRATRAPATWIREAHAVAGAYGSGLNTHVAETAGEAAAARAELGTSEIRYLDALGVVDERFVAAHCVAIDDDDRSVLAERSGTAVYCPVSNMYLASGIADVPALLARGVRVALGTDGPASNDNQDMFAVMKFGSLLQRVAHRDAALLPPAAMLAMATSGGAQAGGGDGGTIAVGALADLAIVDLSGPHHQPLHRPVASLVHGAQPHDVESVVVDGRVVVDHRRVVGVAESDVLREATVRAARMAEAAGLAAPLALPHP